MRSDSETSESSKSRGGGRKKITASGGKDVLCMTGSIFQNLKAFQEVAGPRPWGGPGEDDEVMNGKRLVQDGHKNQLEIGL